MTCKEIFATICYLLFGLMCGIIGRSDGLSRADADWMAVMPSIRHSMIMTGWYQCEAGKSDLLTRAIDLDECKRKRECA